MAQAGPAHDGPIRFGVFELDVRAGELRKAGFRTRLQEQPLQVLLMLLDRPGEVVTRDELRARLWPNGTVVDFEHSVNAAIKRLREALDDLPANPRFIETLPRRGYRFIAPVETALAPSPSARPESQQISKKEEAIADSTRDPHVPETVGHYQVLDRVDAGAIGVVYRARNLRLGNNVAIKFLRPAYTSDGSRVARFKQEARATAALHHPNILAVYDLGDSDGIPYIVSELLEGVTLRKRLQGPLPQASAINYAVQILKGLTAAHGKNIIHRDLKPENIFVTTDERVKILDFGIAKLKPSKAGGLERAITDEASTLPGAILGTVGYMSPEQVRGESSDERSDIFAFGTILYEMFTGLRAFAAPTPVETLSAILNAEPEALLPGKSSLPGAIVAVLRRCLKKAAANRFQSAQEVIRALEQLDSKPEPRMQFPRISTHTATTRPRGTAAVPPKARAKVLAVFGVLVAAIAIAATAYVHLARKPHVAITKQITSVAVVPLANLSGDPQQEYLADGITESLITDLGRLTGLKVARGSVMRYKWTKMPLAEIARELKVDALITGAVLRSGDRVRVTAQLIGPENGQQLWTESYEQDVRDVLRLENELTRAIAAEVRVKLTADEQARLAPAGSVDPEAYHAYLMGRYQLYKMSPQGFDKALEYFQMALDKNPNYTPALVGSASVWSLREHFGHVGAGEGWAKAKPAVMKALESDPTSAEAHQVLASHLAWGGEFQWDAGLKEYERAIELNANYADARFFYSLTLYTMRRDEAVKQMELAIELDPYNASYQRYLADELTDEGHPDLALLELDRVAALDPANAGQHISRMRAYQRKRQYPQAIEELKICLSTTRPEVVQALERGYATRDYKLAMRSVAEALAARFPKGTSPHLSNGGYTPIMPMLVAELYAAAGDDDRALDWLEAGYESRLHALPYVNAQGAFQHMRSQPRFQQLLRRMNLPQ